MPAQQHRRQSDIVWDKERHTTDLEEGYTGNIHKCNSQHRDCEKDLEIVLDERKLNGTLIYSEQKCRKKEQ